MNILDADAILAADDVKYETVPCPEWGGSVVIRSLEGHERDSFEESCVTKKRKLNKRGKAVTEHAASMARIRAKLVALAACKDVGNPERIFTDSQVIALSKKNAAPLDRCFASAQTLSGLSDDDIEELAGNSETAPKGELG